MTTDMDDVSFYDLFKGSYPSVFAARIMRMPDGTSKHFAFVRFHDEAEYSQALSHENQISMQLGCRIRVRTLIPCLESQFLLSDLQSASPTAASFPCHWPL